MTSRGLVLLMAALAVATSACSRKTDKSGTAIARGDGVTVTRDEFEAKLQEQSPLIRARYSTLERKKEFLENLLRFELLAAEAERQKLDRDPEVREAVRRLMVQRLVRKSFDEGAEAKAVSDADARAYFEAHLDEFQKPERLRLSGIFLRAEPGTPARAGKAADAQRLLARIRSEEAKNPLAFSNAARDHSDDLLSKTAGGDLGHRTREELAKQQSAELAKAASALRDVGQLSSVVETPQGFWILKLAGRQPALDRSFDEVKGQLAARIAREKRSKGFDDFVTSLRAKAKIEIDDAALEKIAVVAPAAGAPGAPPPSSDVR